ncbi:MAG: ribosomal protein L3 N(5)-glutamine methyltransferase [Coxiella sp. RIFCSPHIGHO2_12_FULL_42_15]|nr:MAG: ribosomal protein L3 N(5)-glutamine methyltransferase [Coxiella sp. RIFCSPHIGHO2_12_FULL_42_15]
MSKTQKQEYHELLSELISVGDWIRWSASRFKHKGLYFGHGTDNAWDEAAHLVLQTLHLPIDCDPMVFHAKVTIAERKDLIHALQKRIEERIPLPYITHQAWLMGLPFYVDERVLIPRSPFAEWISKQFQPWIDPEHVQRILEIGTGSGCLAIACALLFPYAAVDAVDIDPAALEVAHINAERHAVRDRVHFIHGDCFQGVGDVRYDIIISNPPYVSKAEMATLPTEYLHEPRFALEAQEEGLAMALKILAEAGNYLCENGILMIEVGNSQTALIERLPNVPFVWLEQEHGGHGLFLLTKLQMDELPL